MSYEYYIKSPCKINLSLLVHKQREDGYHELTSIFQMIDLYDDISLIKSNDDRIEVLGDFDCRIEDNLIYKAAKIFKEFTSISEGFRIHVKKQIPAGGGIGGGSGNCASILRLLNFIYDKPVTDKDLLSLGLSLGSDVPFFMESPTAMVEGRGEHLTSIPTISNYFILLVNPGVHISTAKAFNILKASQSYELKEKFLAKDQIYIYNKGLKNFSFFKNSFEFALHSDYTFIRNVKEALIREGALHAALSGSGSTMFGIFDNREAAVRAMSSFSTFEHYKLFLVEPLTELPNIYKRRV